MSVMGVQEIAKGKNQNSKSAIELSGPFFDHSDMAT
jgi:hypothetical protein